MRRGEIRDPYGRPFGDIPFIHREIATGGTFDRGEGPSELYARRFAHEIAPHASVNNR